MREWLPSDHSVWLLIDMVAELDTSELHARYRTGGAGRAAYDPDMMLTLLVYAYSRGVLSSRRIEGLCWTDVAFRVICAGDVPDHNAIWRFTERAGPFVERLFTEVLVLCARVGLGKLETITLDGTKIGVNASKSANRSEDHIRAELARVSAEAVATHQATDAEEDTLFGVDNRGDEVPEELTDGRTRVARLRRALADLEQERKAEQAKRDATARQHLQRLAQGERLRGNVPTVAEVEAAQLRLAQAIAAQQAKIDDWERRNAEKIAATGNGLTGPPPQPVEEHSSVKRARSSLAKALEKQAERERKEQQQRPAVRNTTDPDTRLMPVKGGGFIQGLNAQNVVCADHVILATDLVQDPGDVEQWVPMMGQAEKAADLITTTQAEQAKNAGQACACPHNDNNNDNDNSTPGVTPSAETAKQAKPACPIHPNGIGTAVGDAGYLSRSNLTAPGPDRLIATGKRRNVEKTAREATDQLAPDEPDTELNPVETMQRRLLTPEGMATYRQRGHIAETPHGHIKHNMGIRALTRRGLARLKAQWKFICAVYNLGRLQQTLTKTGNELPTTT
jgi:transposase